MNITRAGGNGRRSLSTESNGLVFTSGITTTDLEGDILAQARDVLAQIDNILKRQGTEKNKVLKAQIFLASMSDYGAFNSVWDEWIIDGFEPAREVIEARLALDEYKIKISVIAAK